MLFTLKNSSMPKDSFLILGSVLRRRLSERNCGIGEGGYCFDFEIDTSFSKERYQIEICESSATFKASDSASLFAAVGHFLYSSCFDGFGNFSPPEESVIDFTPEKPLRGMYFATHFHNFYHNAPLEKVYEVIEDMALRGCNALLVWYDMHHYTSIDEPASREMIDRLKAFMRYAEKIGMKVAMTMISNEGFSSSPKELRAEWQAQGNYRTRPMDHYHVELCPSKEGGLSEILRERREMLEAFADVSPDFAVFWPYDQGGCTCSECEPWGANGMMKILPGLCDLLSEIWPCARIIYSTWYFDRFIDGEWDAFYPKLGTEELSCVDYIMSFFFNGELPKVIAEKGIPEGVRFIDFPEISMYSCEPWGAYGATVLARFLDRTNEKSGHLYSGGFPYSEGIYEDINKHIILSAYTGRHKSAADAVREWVRFELCAGDDLAEALLESETSLARTKYQTEHPYRFVIKDTGKVEEIFEVVSAYDEKLPPRIRTSTRWRMVYLRAIIDRELVRTDFYSGRSPICQDAFRELCEIYYATDETHRWVKPPVEG